jgi:SAM-dependent methyltransferase
LAKKTIEQVAAKTGLSEEQLKRKYPYSFGQAQPAKGDFKEGMSQALDLGTDVAPIVGTAKAAAELPEDAKFAYQLLEEGYDEGDIKKMGLGAGYTALTVAGLLPGAKVAADVAKKGIKEGVKSAVEETAEQTKRAFKMPPPEAAQKTQIATTGPTYAKAKDILDAEVSDGKTLDFGAGRGLGAKDIKADTYEPFPREGFSPTFTDASDIPDASYEKITSLNVLNVVPRETRDKLVLDIGRVLKPGGSAVISTRGKDVLDAKGVPGPEPMSLATSSGTYQKGFTQKELTTYVQETLGDNFTVVPVKGVGKAGVKVKKKSDNLKPEQNVSVTKTAARTTATPRMGYDPNNESNRVFHLTKADFDTADVIGSGTSDIGFHVGTAQQATARGSTQTKYDPELAEQMAKGERILPMVLKTDLKPARIVDMSNFKVPGSWLANLSVASSDLQRIKFLKNDESDAVLFAKAPKVKIGGETYTMLPDAMRAGMDEGLWRDIVLEAHRAKRRGLDTINNQEDRVKWFNTLKKTANKNGYDSFVYRNEYEGTADENVDQLVEQILRAQRGEIDAAEIDINSRFADSYMLLEPNQVKGLFGGMTESSPEYMKNKGGLMLQKGGAVPMKEQMEMFEDGGLMDEGGTVDPVSGNDVPPGSTQEEVRDDIPAQLSEGEFVFPADVVRYIGLGNLMRMRQEAKMGLKLMDQMGQMGNSEEATIPDDLPFDINDLDMDDEEEYNSSSDDLEMQVGGFVPAQQQQQQQFGIAGYQAAPTPTTSFTAQPVQAASQQFVQPVTRPAQAYVPTQQVPTPMPTFGEITGPGVPEVDFEFATFRNEAGQEIQLRIKKGSRGELLSGEVLPEGYSWVDPTATQTEEVTTTPQTTQTTRVVERDDSDERDDGLGPGGGRVGMGGFSDGTGRRQNATIMGVSFDMGEGFIGGAMGAGATALSLATGKPIPAEATATFTFGNQSYTVPGSTYNELKTSGYTGSKADEIVGVLKGEKVHSGLGKGTLKYDAETKTFTDTSSGETFTDNDNDNDGIGDILNKAGQTIYSKWIKMIFLVPHKK